MKKRVQVQVSGNAAFYVFVVSVITFISSAVGFFLAANKIIPVVLLALSGSVIALCIAVFLYLASILTGLTFDLFDCFHAGITHTPRQNRK